MGCTEAQPLDWCTSGWRTMAKAGCRCLLCSAAGAATGRRDHRRVSVPGAVRQRREVAFYVDPADLKGKTVRAVADPLNQQVEGLVVKVLRSHSRYYDSSDGKELLSYTEYAASGGVLIRTLTGDASFAPMTFQSSCSPLPKTDFGFKFSNDRR
jgi:hypothetical protein